MLTIKERFEIVCRALFIAECDFTFDFICNEFKIRDNKIKILSIRHKTYIEILDQKCSLTSTCISIQLIENDLRN